DLDLTFLAPLAQTHDPVDGVQVGPGRGLDHVGRHAASRHLEAVGLHLDHDVAERVAAAGDRVDLEVGEPALDARCRRDGGDGSVDHPVAGSLGVDLAVAVRHND